VLVIFTHQHYLL